MKKLSLVLAATCALVGFQATALTSRPAVPATGWACKFTAKVNATKSSIELAIVRHEKISATGKAVCTDTLLGTRTFPVTITMTSTGFGPALNGSVEGLKLVGVRAGIASLEDLFGAYRLSGGLRLGLLTKRANGLAGVQVSGGGVGGGVEIAVENRFSVGLDLAAMTMTIN